MTDTVTLNHNQATCIVERPMIGHKRYDNICTGTTHETPWTGAEWASFVLMFVIVGAMVVGFAHLATITLTPRKWHK